NAAVVLEAVEVLRARGWKLEQSDVEHGLYAVSWPGRFELINDEPEFIVDGGHNPQCAQSVRENLLSYFPESYRVLLIGVLRDKDFENLTDILNTVADEYVCISPDSPRALPAAELADTLEKYGKNVTVCTSIEDGVETEMDIAAAKGGMVCAVGSLYSVGDIRAYFELY
ncbi:MAG: bifunctional folylpolyglutamate synthase/dihydrofolate synthase, partial [Oscillospiraceae bacterium]|nr:bifunctional folylpolyglutamate synthase/dihydrofolate synthase [Oscillospiraceae bacterium]